MRRPKLLPLSQPRGILNLEHKGLNHVERDILKSCFIRQSYKAKNMLATWREYSPHNSVRRDIGASAYKRKRKFSYS